MFTIGQSFDVIGLLCQSIATINMITVRGLRKNHHPGIRYEP
jgi:hypothetical protein